MPEKFPEYIQVVETRIIVHVKQSSQGFHQQGSRTKTQTQIRGRTESTSSLDAWSGSAHCSKFLFVQGYFSQLQQFPTKQVYKIWARNRESKNREILQTQTGFAAAKNPTELTNPVPSQGNPISNPVMLRNSQLLCPVFIFIQHTWHFSGHSEWEKSKRFVVVGGWETKHEGNVHGSSSVLERTLPNQEFSTDLRNQGCYWSAFVLGDKHQPLCNTWTTNAANKKMWKSHFKLNPVSF